MYCITYIYRNHPRKTCDLEVKRWGDHRRSTFPKGREAMAPAPNQGLQRFDRCMCCRTIRKGILQVLDGSIWFYLVFYSSIWCCRVFPMLLYDYVIWFHCRHDLPTFRQPQFSSASHAHPPHPPAPTGETPAGSDWSLALRLFCEMPVLKLASDVYTCAAFWAGP